MTPAKSRAAAFLLALVLVLSAAVFPSGAALAAQSEDAECWISDVRTVRDGIEVTMSYAGLEPGVEYTAMSVLTSVADGTDSVLMGEGMPLLDITAFTPDAAGTPVLLRFQINPETLAGLTLSAIAEVYADEALLASTEGGSRNAAFTVPGGPSVPDDPQPAGQPEVLSFTADINEDTGMAAFTAQIAPGDIPPDKSCTLTAILVRADSGQPLMTGPGILMMEKSVRQGTGTVTLTCKTPASDSLRGFDIALAVMLRADDDAWLAIPEASGPAVRLPEHPQIHSVNLAADAPGTLTAEASLRNLTPGTEYTLTALLKDMDDPEIPDLSLDGATFQSTANFTAGQEEETLRVRFSSLPETLNGRTVSVAFDLTSAQSDYRASYECTSASPKVTLSWSSGDTENARTALIAISAASDSVTVTARSADLVFGNRYTLEAVLTDCVTFEPILKDGSAFMVPVSFTADSSQEETDVVFALPDDLQEKLAGRIVTASFRLKNTEGEEIAAYTADDDSPWTTVPRASAPRPDGVAVQTDKLVLHDNGIETAISFSGVIAGENYIATVTLTDRDTGSDLTDGGRKITNAQRFSADAPQDTLQMFFTLDPAVLSGYEVTARITFTNRDGVLLAETTGLEAGTPSLNLKKQTDPKVKPQSMTLSDGGVTVTAEYSDLPERETCFIVGTLIDSRSGEPVLPDGAPCTVSETFRPQTGTGTARLFFRTDIQQLRGTDVGVRLQIVLNDGTVLCTNSGTGNDYTTIDLSVPSLTGETRITGLDSVTDEDAGRITVTAVLALDSLEKAHEYKLTGTLVDAITGKVILADGKPITTEQIASFGENTAGLEFAGVPASVLSGHSLCVFAEIEKLHDGSSVLRLESTRPSIQIPEYNPSALISELTLGDGSIEAVVSYTGLEPGQTYTVKGQIADSTTGDAVLANGEPVTAEGEFTPRAAAGNVTLVFRTATEDMAGRSVTVQAQIRKGDIIIADSTSADGDVPSVDIPRQEVPEAKKNSIQSLTYETNEENGRVTITAVICLDGNDPEKEYGITSTLVDALSATPIILNDRPVQIVKNTKAGTVRLTLTYRNLNPEDLKGAAIGASVEIRESETGRVTDRLGGSTPSVTVPTSTTTVKVLSLEEKGDGIAVKAAYDSLRPGQTYTVTAELADRRTGKTIAVDGKTVGERRVFIPSERDGEVILTCPVYPDKLDGFDVVAHVRIFVGNTLIADNTDNYGGLTGDNNPGIDYTVKAPDNDVTVTVASAEAVSGGLFFSVPYAGLNAGETYILKGYLANKVTGADLRVRGEYVTVSQSLIPASSIGAATLFFPVDTEDLAGFDVAARAEIISGSVIIAQAHVTPASPSVDLTDLSADDPEPTKKPAGTASPSPKPSPSASASPSSSKTPKPSGSAQASASPSKTPKPSASSSAAASASPSASATQSASKTPVPSPKPSPDASASASASASPSPDASASVRPGPSASADVSADASASPSASQNDADASPSASSDPGGTGISLTVTKAEKGASDLRFEVSYTGLTPGEIYQVRGSLIDVRTGEIILINGRAVTTSQSVAARTESGRVSFTLNVNPALLAGHEAGLSVVLYKDSLIVAATSVTDGGLSFAGTSASPAPDASAVSSARPSGSASAVNAAGTSSGTWEPEADKEPDKGPAAKTGDDSSLGIWLLLCITAGMAVFTVLMNRKEDK